MLLLLLLLGMAGRAECICVFCSLRVSLLLLPLARRLRRSSFRTCLLTWMNVVPFARCVFQTGGTTSTPGAVTKTGAYAKNTTVRERGTKSDHGEQQTVVFRMNGRRTPMFRLTERPIDGNGAIYRPTLASDCSVEGRCNFTADNALGH